MTKTMIELFCGTKTMSNEFKNSGYKVFTIDNNPKFNPDLCIDILEFDISMIPEEFQNPTVVWASPPCTTFSVASLSHYWKNGKPKSHKTYLGLAIAFKTIELIGDLKPSFFFIENPRGMMRKQHFFNDFHRKTVTYCKYGDFRQKPTDIWTNCINWQPKKMCSPGDNCHESAKRGCDRGTQYLHGAEKRSEIPKGLAEEIVSICKGNNINLKRWFND